jgi:glycosyltransferase involved in cell wall biosynthesis
MPKVSVIIPVYNAEAYLRECLDSVVSQTLDDIEIICVNDGATDGSGGILREYARRDARITVIDQENQGLSGARNSGLDRAVGDFVLFLDSDDYFESTTVEDMYARCREDDAEVGVFKIRYVYVDTGVSIEGAGSLRADLAPKVLPFSRMDMTGYLFRFSTPNVCNKMFKTSFIAEAALRFSPDLRRAEDLPFTYVALSTAKRITLVDKVLYNYRKGAPDSLQATIHEEPFEICKALLLARQATVERGVFGEIERDFVNAALYQCLFTLETLKTAEAFRELYAGLRDTYFAELGLDGHPRDYFYAERHYEQYEKIATMSPEEYLFDEAQQLRGELRDSHARVTAARAKLAKSENRLKKLRRSRAYKMGQRVSAAAKKIRNLGPASRKVD